MNEIVDTFLLVGDKFMPEMHLRQSGFTCSACGPFIKNKGRIQKFKETGDSQYIYEKELDKACCQQHDMTYGEFKDLSSRTASDKICDKAFNIAKNLKCDGYQGVLASMFYRNFDKKFSSGSVKNENMPNQQLAKELQKPIIRKFEK